MWNQCIFTFILLHWDKKKNKNDKYVNILIIRYESKFFTLLQLRF